MAVAIEREIGFIPFEENREEKVSEVVEISQWRSVFLGLTGGLDLEVAVGRYGYRFHTPSGLASARKENENLLYLAKEGVFLNQADDQSEDAIRNRKISLYLRSRALRRAPSFGFMRLPSDTYLEGKGK